MSNEDSQSKAGTRRQKLGLALDNIINVKIAQRLAAGLSVGFLFIHVSFLALFWTYGVTPMVYFNIFSVLFYLASLIMVNRKAFSAWLYLTYAEVIAHMSCAVYFVGWDCGFQITLIAIIFQLFFSEYVGHSTGINYPAAAPLSSISAVAFVALYVLHTMHEPEYSLPDEVEFVLYITMSIITFGIAIANLRMFLSIAVRAQTLLSDMANHDKLTGLANRYFMSERLNKLIAEDGSENLWLAMIDIDDFKSINDTYGHVCGDRVLISLADLLSSFSPDVEACRWGGEEFLLSGKTDQGLDEVRESLDRLRLAVAKRPITYEGLTLNYTITAGLAAYIPGSSIVEWISNVDQKLYYGKRNGKNQIVA